MDRTLIQGSKAGITIAAMTAALMAILDISIVNVALSDIRASFGTPLDQIAWVSTGYMMANVVVIPMTGWLQKRFGFRNYFCGSIAIFVIASILCGLSWNLPSLVAFRILQGMGGGAIIPTSQAILFARYPQKEHGMAGALFGLGAVTGPLLGPAFGGYLIDIASWHWIFLINVPIGIFAIYMAWRHIDEPNFQSGHDPIDRAGLAMLIMGMGSLQFVLEEGNRDDWFQSTKIIVLSCIAAVSLICFIVHELETENPIVDLRVFKDLSYTAATGINFLVGTALFSASFLFSLYCGSVMGYKALDIGMLFLKGCWIQVLIMPLIGRFGNKADGRLMVLFGITVLTYSLYMQSHFTASADSSILLLPLFIRSVGLGFIFVPLSVMALSGLPPQQRGNGAALYNLTRELGGSIGTAWMGTILSRQQSNTYSYFSEHINAWSAATQERLNMLKMGIGSKLFDADTSSLAILRGLLQKESLIKAFNNCYVEITIIFALGILLIIFLKKPKDLGEEIFDAH